MMQAKTTAPDLSGRTPEVGEPGRLAALPSLEVSGADEDRAVPCSGVRLAVTDLVLSRTRLVAVLYEFSFLPGDVLAEMGPEQVRRFVVAVYLHNGGSAVDRAVDRLAGPVDHADVWDSAFLELCERQIEVAFGLPGREYEHLNRWLAPFEAWKLFEAENGPVAPISPAPTACPVGRDESWTVSELVVVP